VQAHGFAHEARYLQHLIREGRQVTNLNAGPGNLDGAVAATYEETALKRLMSLHGTREAEVDHLLRAGKLVDLYKVVREGLRVSEPRYSIKNLEIFYGNNAPAR